MKINQMACPSISVFLQQALMIWLKVNAISHPLQDQRPVCRKGDKRCWKNLNSMAGRRLMIVVKLQDRLMPSASVESGRKKNLIRLNPPMKWHFFSTQSCEHQDLALIVFLCGENWGSAIIRLREEHFSGSWTHILRGGGSRVYWLGGRHPSIFLARESLEAVWICPAESLDIVRLYWYTHVHEWWGEHRWRVWKSESEY